MVVLSNISRILAIFISEIQIISFKSTKHLNSFVSHCMRPSVTDTMMTRSNALKCHYNVSIHEILQYSARSSEGISHELPYLEEDTLDF